MRFAQAHNLKLDGKSGPAMGSDAVLPLDGRYSIGTCKARAREHFTRLNANLNKGYIGFTIEAGNFSSSHIVAPLAPLA